MIGGDDGLPGKILQLYLFSEHEFFCQKFFWEFAHGRFRLSPEYFEKKINPDATLACAHYYSMP